ncbi:MAG: hypothetical protein HYX78_04115 [Armatimonadetes bacterium]|nr:hypothetical protein [Armatimonadota bacterium]
MADQKRIWAVAIGAAAGATAVSFGIWWYVRSRAESQPIKDAQQAITRAYEKIKEIENIATMRFAQ